MSNGQHWLVSYNFDDVMYWLDILADYALSQSRAQWEQSTYRRLMLSAHERARAAEKGQ